MFSPASAQYLSDFVVQLLGHSFLIIISIAVFERLFAKDNATFRSRLWVMAVLAIGLLPLLMVLPKPNLWPAGDTPAIIASVHTPVAEASIPSINRVTAAEQISNRPTINKNHQQWLTNITPLLFYGWCLIVVLGLIKLVLQLRLGSGIRSRAKPASSHLTTKVKRIADRLSVKPCLDVRITNEISSPCTLGIVKPCILLPAKLASHANAAVLEHTLMHELAHIKRRDMQLLVLSRLFQAFWFFNPALWVASRCAENMCEPACDDLVLANATTPNEYADSLLSVAEIVYTQPQPVLALHIADTQTMRLRLKRLLDLHSNHSTHFRPRAVSFLSILLCGWIALASALFPHAYAEPQPPQLTVTDNQTKLLSAAWSGNARVVDNLITQVEEINQINSKQAPRTALIAAAMQGHTAIIDKLLDAGADVNLYGPDDGTALIEAAQSGHLKSVQVLLDAGADVNESVEKSGTALIAAAAAGHLEITDLLISAGADVNAAVRLDGTPLTAAARAGNLEIVTRLVTSGAEINVHVPLDDTPMINAVHSGDIQIVEYLLDNGADPNQHGDLKQGVSRTPLSEAKRLKLHRIESLLITAGAAL